MQYLLNKPCVTSDVFFLTSKAIIQMYIFLFFIVLNDGILFLYPILNRELQFFFFLDFIEIVSFPLQGKRICL